MGKYEAAASKEAYIFSYVQRMFVLDSYHRFTLLIWFHILYQKVHIKILLDHYHTTS